MIHLALAALFLPLSHFLIASAPLRGQLIRWLGDERYLVSYSAVTLIAFAWLILAYLRAPALALWATPGWAAALLLPVARQHRIPRHHRIVRSGRQEEAPAWRGVARIRCGNVERAVPGDHSRSPVSVPPRDRATADRVRARRFSDYACL